MTVCRTFLIIIISYVKIVMIYPLNRVRNCSKNTVQVNSIFVMNRFHLILRIGIVATFFYSKAVETSTLIILCDSSFNQEFK